VFVESDNCKTHAPRDLLAVFHDKQNVLLFSVDPDFLQSCSWNLSVFTAGTDQSFGQDRRLRAIRYILDFALGVERPHAKHFLTIIIV
jgi:hypothetical protein